MSITLLANGKLNLFLQIQGLDTQTSFHYLQTIMLPIQTQDTIYITTLPYPSFEFISSDPFLMDLYHHHHLNFQKVFFRFQKLLEMIKHTLTSGIKIRFDPYIPYQSGLGITSAQSVIFFKFLLESFKIHLKKDDFLKIIAEFGMDCPFFYWNCLCESQHFGERITPLKFSFPYPFLIIKNNDFNVNTTEAYKILKQHQFYDTKPRISQFKKALKTQNLEKIKQASFNSFEHLYLKTNINRWGDEIRLIKHLGYHLLEASIVSLSGSGGAFYLVFDSIKKMEKAKCFFKEEKNFFIAIKILDLT